MSIQVKRLGLLLVLTLCALLATLGLTRLAQAGNRASWRIEPTAPAGAEIISLTLESSRPTAFYDPGPRSVDRTVYFDNQGMGNGQIITVRAWISSSHPISYFQGGPAFGITSSLVLTPPWQVSYTVSISDGTQPAVAFVAVSTDDLSSSFFITFSLDISNPTGLITTPAISNGPFVISFHSFDEGSGVSKTEFWALPPGGTWENTGIFTSAVSGNFVYSPAGGEGVYQLAAAIWDWLSNPGVSNFEETLLDISPPTATITGPVLVSQSQVLLQWWATDTLSGPAETQVWIRPPATSSWQTEGLPQTGLSGSITCQLAIPGRYYLAAVATDQAGNRELTPTLTGEMSTLYDPDPPVITELLTHSSQPTRYYHPGGESAFFNSPQVITITVVWTDSNPASLQAGPAFGTSPPVVLAPPWRVSYTIPLSPPLYTRIPFTVSDGGGLTSSVQLTLARDLEPPGAILTAPQYANGPVPVGFEALDPGGSGVARLALWRRNLAGESWLPTGLVTGSVTGTFHTIPPAEGRYAWGAVITDHVGNLSPGPLLTGLQTIYDLTPPQVLVTAPALAESAPISIHLISSDALSGLASTELWSRPIETSTWAATGLIQTVPYSLGPSLQVSGTFLLTPTAPGRIFFAAMALDLAGNRSITPTGNGDSSTLYDPGPPLITGLEASSSWPNYFYNPGLTGRGGRLYFQDAITQSVALSVAWAEARKAGLIGSPAFGISPTMVITEPWVLTYPIGTGAADLTVLRLTVSDTEGLTDTAWISFTRDVSPPAGSAAAPLYANAAFDVQVTATDQGGSGVAASELWFRPPTSSIWQASGLVSSALSITWLFSPTHGEGPYYFSPVVTDRVGNVSVGPALTDTGTLYDLTAPTSMLGTAEGFANSSPISLTFWSSDSMSGLARTELWVREPLTVAWSATGLHQGGVSGTFIYSPSAGDGLYRFASSATDRADNQEAEPDAAETSLTLDRSAPSSTVSTTAYISGGLIAANWTATDTHSGVALVTLWVKRPPTHTWEATSLTSTLSSGLFPYQPDVDGIYYFATVAQDSAGNVEDAPSGDGDSYTRLDTIPPLITSTGIVENSPFLYAQGDILYYGDGMSGVEGFAVTGIASDTNSGLERALFSTAFNVTPSPDPDPAVWAGNYPVSNQDWGDGQIWVRVYDRAGLDSSTVFGYLRDTAAPSSTLLAIPSSTTSAQITILWAAADQRSGVDQTELWTRPQSGDWAATGVTQSGEGGIFSYTLPVQGWYYLASEAADRVSNREEQPTGEGDGSLLFDASPPESSASSVWGTSSSPITVTWTVTDLLSGVAWTELWVQVGPTGVWTRTGAISSALTGTFTFTPTVQGPYYFATRAQDRLGNNEAIPSGTGDSMTWFDTMGPSSSITAPVTSHSPVFEVGWSAYDSGVGLDPEGAFSVDYKVGDGGWTPWLTRTNELARTFGPTQPITVAYDVTYSFRVRAWDRLGNQGEPISTSTRVEKALVYLPIATAGFAPFTREGFENGWNNWSHGGELAVSLVSNRAHSGQHSVLLGDPSYACENGVPVGSAWVERSLSVPPASSGTPAIQIWYNMWSQDKFFPTGTLKFYFDGLQVDINGEPVDAIGIENMQASCSVPATNSGWQLWEVPIPSRYQGSNITLRIGIHNRPDRYFNSWVFIDDISLVIAP